MGEGAITLDTAGGSVPIEEMGRLEINGVTAYPRAVDPLATPSLFSASLAEMDGWHNEQGGGQTTLYHTQQHRRIPLSKFGDLCVLVDASSMIACAVEAGKEIKIMVGDGLLCHIPRMREFETAIQPFCVRDGVNLDHLRRGHVDFDPARWTCNKMQMRHLQHRRQFVPQCTIEQ